MHLDRLTEAVQSVVLSLAERQAAAVHLHEHTCDIRPLTPLERLDELWRREGEARLRSGFENLNPGGSRPLLQAALWKSERNVLMSYVSRPPPRS